MFDEARLNHLIESYFDQRLTPDEKKEFEAMLLGSSRAREIFLDHTNWHGLTREWALREMSLESPPESVTPVPRPPRRLLKLLCAGAGIAACLFLAWQGFHRPVDPPATVLEKTPEIPRISAQPRKYPLHADVAMLGQTTGVDWSDGTPRQVAGSPLPKGWLHFRKGTLRLDFYSGATVIVEGPASLELLSPFRMRLDKGKLTANVPPPAEGFTIVSADLQVVDRGTEFGMNVGKPGDCEVHVFKGEVELQGSVPVSAPRKLRQGDALAIREGTVVNLRADRGSFMDPAVLYKEEALESEAQWKTWREASDSFRSTPGLLVYFDFENREPGSSILPNRAAKADIGSSGTVVGCEALSGRWPGKSAIGFTKTSDRVRFRTSGSMPSLTLMAWVRVDSILLEHSSLLTMSPEEVGELHWKLGKSGRIIIGMRASKELKYSSWERLESPVVVTRRDLGRWMHIATVIDGDAKVMRHFVNGEQVASGPISRPTPVRLGLANLGNFDAPPGERVKYGESRSFNGRIDEFAMINRSLSNEEIRRAAR
ncbi:FecR domain-containing protein [Luteolibacter sp. SL250]|uniref:LamG-like jellyroll fold domain-containing protein n=1 Tax=Luteolibacter sp. SL250 TaxID=2995170 RepID=UPI00226EAB41|nr:LamG-like jellyroll fold domain-containing protein [Luteolibacter sp. SL250]WAC17985.1 FecR domain-containing protein [Luteolibacter sp. SL250]